MLGVPFDNITIQEAVALVEKMVVSGRPHYFVTPNVDFLVQARKDVELRRILLDAHLVLCDGMPLVWASRMLGNPLPERVAGADLVPRLVSLAAEKNFRIFLLGGTVNSTANAVARLQAEYPGLAVAGYSPPFDPLLAMDHEGIKRRIQEFQPHFLFVSFGCPKQEKWLAMHHQSLGVPVCAGVGGTIDFLAGQLKRAPAWMQRTGTEWLFRLAQEPRRLFRRYVEDLTVFGGAILAQWWRLRPRGRGLRSIALAKFHAHTPQREEKSTAWRRNQRSAASMPLRRAYRQKLSGFHLCIGGWRTVKRHRCHAPMPSWNCSRTAGVITNGNTAGCDRPPGEMKPWRQIALGECVNLIVARDPELSPEQLISDERPCLLRLDAVRSIDSAGMAWLMRLNRSFRAAGRHLVLLAPSRAVTRTLKLLRIEQFFATAPDAASACELIEARIREQAAVVGAHFNASALLLWQGEITAANAEHVWRLTEAQISGRPASGQVVIDLSRVRFIDSSGLSLMERARNLALSHGLRVNFTGAQPAVKNVLQLARLNGALWGACA